MGAVIPGQTPALPQDSTREARQMSHRIVTLLFTDLVEAASS